MSGARRATASQRASRADRGIFVAGFAASVLLHLAAFLSFRLPAEALPSDPARHHPAALALTAIALSAADREAAAEVEPAAERLEPLPEQRSAEPAGPQPPALAGRPLPAVVPRTEPVLPVDSLAPPPPRADRSSSVARSHGEYERQIAQAVERKREYPLAARRRGQEGTAIVRLRLAEDGSLLAAQIVRDSGHALLDRAALGMVRRAAPFPRAPAALRQAQLEILLPIEFSVR